MPIEIIILHVLPVRAEFATAGNIVDRHLSPQPFKYIISSYVKYLDHFY